MREMGFYAGAAPPECSRRERQASKEQNRGFNPLAPPPGELATSQMVTERAAPSLRELALPSGND